MRRGAAWESLDYDAPISQAFIEYTRAAERMPKRPFGITGRTAWRWILTSVLGIVMGVVAYMLMFFFREPCEAPLNYCGSGGAQ